MRQANENNTAFDTLFQGGVFRAFILLLGLLAIPLSLNAQITTATITGTISDPGGAQVPSATVTARNVDTGHKRTVVSGDDGNYRIEFLPVGNYVIEVTATTGFKKAYRDGIVLRVNDILRLDFALEVGTVAEVVTVTTAPPEINTSNAELGRTVQSREIENLPLVERNVYALLDVTPGVQSNNSGIATASATTSNLSLGFPEQRTLINGGTDGGTGSVNYYLDGGTNMTFLRNTGNILPNPDAIQEFRVQTNAYSAEYGRFANGIINVLTKSGTNKFHGSLYEYYRDDEFNANEWGSVVARPPYRRNQFGGSIGGPIKKDKTFFFFSYAGLRQLTNQFLSGARVPSALERVGNFTERLGTDPRNPPGGQVILCGTNIICPASIDPVAARIINDYIPLPNMTLPNGRPGWQGNVPLPYNSNEFLVKLDHQLNEPHRLSFSYFNTAGNATVFPGSGNLPWATQSFKWRQHSLNLSDVWVIDSDKINQVWVTFTRTMGGRLNVPDTSLADLGSSFTPQGTPSLPQITIAGYFTLSNAIGGPRAGTNLYSIRDVFSWIKGRHSLKIGGELSLNKDIQETLLNNYSVWTFAAGTSSAANNALANFLIGKPTGLTQDAPVTPYTNSWYTALFIQDDFRIHPHVNLNLGFRWDIQTPPRDPENRVVNYDPNRQSVVRPDAPRGALFYGDAGVERGAIPTSFTHFSPRFGIAWDPFGDGKTSVRAATGLFWGSISGNEWNTMTNFQPFSTRLNFAGQNIPIQSNGWNGATLTNPYNNYPGGNPFPYEGTFAAGGGLFPVAEDFSWPRTWQMNVSIQREVLRDWMVGIAYVGTRASHLPFGRDVNYPVTTPTAGAGNINARRPNLGFAAITMLDSDQNASYDGMQLTTNGRFSKIITFNAFYTFSKTLSSVQLHNNTTQGLAQNSSRLDLEKGLADTHQAHVFSGSLNFEPDFYKGDNSVLKHILNGWSIAPIVKIRSGRPFTVTNGSQDANFDGVNTTDRARLVGDPHLDDPTPNMWFNIHAFVRNVPTTGIVIDGNSPRNFLIGPGYTAVDLALSRDFRFTETIKLRFRAEATNAFNNINYDQPNSSAPANLADPGNFGKILSANQMRKIQFGLRLTF